MAKKRMFSKRITSTDRFLDMPMSAQCLYFHLNMEADDDGFIPNAKTIRRMIGASEDDLKILFAKQFLIPFESGVVVIKDWRIHNYIAKDRYTETVYQDEKSKLTVIDGVYTECNTPCIQNVGADKDLDLDKGLDKDLDLDINKDLSPNFANSTADAQKSTKKIKPQKHKHGEWQNVLLTDDELQKLKDKFTDWQERIERLSSYVESTGKKYKNHYATILNWARNDNTASTKSLNSQVPPADLPDTMTKPFVPSEEARRLYEANKGKYDGEGALWST